MGKWQVALLVATHYSIGKGLPFWIGSEHRLLRCMSVGWKGLQDRGLVQGWEHKCKHGWSWCEGRGCINKLSNSHEVTAAGECVVRLLKMSGVYDELVREFLQSDRENDRVQRPKRATA
jgi:hypothetical protein